MGETMINKFVKFFGVVFSMILVNFVALAAESNLLDKLLLNEKIYVIDTEEADINGDGLSDKIWLVGKKYNGKNDIFVENLTVIVEDGVSQKQYMTEENTLSGYHSSIITGDFTGNGARDILIKAETGGSGGIVNHQIYTLKDGKLKLIFGEKENRGVELNGYYQDNYQVDIIIEQREFFIEVSEKADLYRQEGKYDENGHLIHQITPYTYPYSKLELVDWDMDGILELRGYQSIKGVNGADTIGLVKSVLKYIGSRWVIKEVLVTNQ